MFLGLDLRGWYAWPAYVVGLYLFWSAFFETGHRHVRWLLARLRKTAQSEAEPVSAPVVTYTPHPPGDLSQAEEVQWQLSSLQEVGQAYREYERMRADTPTNIEDGFQRFKSWEGSVEISLRSHDPSLIADLRHDDGRVQLSGGKSKEKLRLDRLYEQRLARLQEIRRDLRLHSPKQRTES